MTATANSTASGAVRLVLPAGAVCRLPARLPLRDRWSAQAHPDLGKPKADLHAGAVGPGCGGMFVGPAGPSAGIGRHDRSAGAIPATISHEPLENQYGKTVTLASFRGKTVMVVPFLTLCTDICPLTTGNLFQVEQSLRAARCCGQGSDHRTQCRPGARQPRPAGGVCASDNGRLGARDRDTGRAQLRRPVLRVRLPEGPGRQPAFDRLAHRQAPYLRHRPLRRLCPDRSDGCAAVLDRSGTELPGEAQPEAPYVLGRPGP